MAQTWINGFFFEYDATAVYDGHPKGIQYNTHVDMIFEPVTAEFFKLHAKIDSEMDDALATSYVKAARQELERYGQLSFGDKTMRLRAKELPLEYRLMYGPVKAIVSPLNTYTLFGDFIKSTAVQTNADIQYEVSWGAAGLPEALKIAICQTAAGLYYTRENIVTAVDYPKMMDQARKTVSLYKNQYFI